MDIKNPILKKIWQDRYPKNGEEINDVLIRVARTCSKSEEEQQLFFETMFNGYFIYGGRTMSNAGIGKSLTLNNCFVAPQVQDSLNDIFTKVTLGALTHQRGGGIGYDFSQLRPKGTPTSNDAIASGAISFMDVFNAQTATILQGNRRGANMGVMSIYSMDIEEFINAKATDADRLNHFNLSVMVDDDFMKAKDNNEDIYLHFPVYDDCGKILKDSTQWKQSRKVNSKYLWDLIIRKAYDNGEPGIFFYDNMNKDNNLAYIESILCSNPCAEYLSGTVYGRNPVTNESLNSNDFGGACNLGSIILPYLVENPFTKKAWLRDEKLKQVIHTAVRMLDNVIDINNFPSDIYENYQRNFRTIGLGITGLADVLVMLGYVFGSEEAVQFTDSLMNFIAKEAYLASIELAKEKGSFPLLNIEEFVNSGFIQKHLDKYPQDWAEVVEGIVKYGIRNAKLLSVAPTGTMSLTWGNNCSSGLEPIFSLEQIRDVKIGGQSEDNVQVVKLRDYAYEIWVNMQNDPRNIVPKETFVTAMDLSVGDHLKMLHAVAFNVDMSCSKTINLPSSYSFEETLEVYDYCYTKGIKGCTIFRPNPLRKGILKTEADLNNEELEDAQTTTTTLARGIILEVSDDLVGKKKKIRTGCGTLHIEAWFDPETGNMMEMFLNKGSSGGCLSNTVGISRLLSVGLRGGIPLKALCDQLDSVPLCGSYAVRSATMKDTAKGNSCPMAVGKIIMEMQKEVWSEFGINETDKQTSDIIVKTTRVSETKIEKYKTEDENRCPECGEEIQHIGGCVSCSNCFWSKCG